MFIREESEALSLNIVEVGSGPIIIGKKALKIAFEQFEIKKQENIKALNRINDSLHTRESELKLLTQRQDEFGMWVELSAAEQKTHESKIKTLRRECAHLQAEKETLEIISDPFDGEHNFYILVDDENSAQAQCSICYCYNEQIQGWETVALNSEDSALCMRIIMSGTEGDQHQADARITEIMNRKLDAHRIDASVVEQLAELAARCEPDAVRMKKFKWFLPEMKQEIAQQKVIDELEVNDATKQSTTLLLLGIRDQTSSFKLLSDFEPNEEGQDTIRYYESKAQSAGKKIIVADYETVRQVASRDPAHNTNITKLIIRCHGGPTDPLPTCEDMMVFLKKFPNLKRVVFRTCCGANAKEAKKLLGQAKHFQDAPTREVKPSSTYFVTLDCLTDKSKKIAFLKKHAELHEGDTLVSVAVKDNHSIISHCKLFLKEGKLMLDQVRTHKQDDAQEAYKIYEQSNKNMSETLIPLSSEHAKLVLSTPETQTQSNIPPKQKVKNIEQSTFYMCMWASKQGKEAVTLATRLGKLIRGLEHKLEEEKIERTFSIKVYAGIYIATTAGTFRERLTSEYDGLPKALEIEIGAPKKMPEQRARS